MAPVAVGPADAEPEQATRARRRERMAASAGCLNREPPCKAVGGTPATAPSLRNGQRGHEMPPA